MTSLRRQIAAALVAFTAFSALPVAPVLADQLQDILDRGVVRIGVGSGVPPFDFLDENQQPAGIDVDVANMIAADLGVELEIVVQAGPDRIPNLLTDKVDLQVALLSLTPERARQILFSSPYATTEIGVYGPADANVTGPEDLGDLKIAVPRGTTQDSALTKVAPNASIARFEDNAASTAAYQTGQADLYATADVVAYSINEDANSRKLELKFTLGANYAYVGVKPGEFGMLRWVDQFIHLHTINGDLNQISETWLDRPLAELPKI